MSHTDTTDTERAGLLAKLRRAPSLYPNAFWVCVCFATLGIWMNEVGYSPLFIPDHVGEEILAALNNTRFFFYGGAVVSGLILVVFGNRLDHLFRRNLFVLAGFLGILMCISTILFSTAFLQTAFDPVILSYVACFISTVCYNFFLVILVVTLAEKEGMRIAVICLAVAAIAEMVLDVVLDISLTDIALLTVTALLPLFCGVAVAFIARKTTEENEARNFLVGRERTYHIALVYVMSFGSVAVISAELSGPKLTLFGARGDWLASSTFSMASFAITIAIFALLAWLLLVRRVDDPISTRFQPSLLVIIVGCLLLVANAFVENQLMLSLKNIVANLVSPFAWLLSWSIAASAINSTSVSPYRLLGLRGLLFNMLVIIKIVFLEENSELVNALILVSIFILVCGLTVLAARINQPTKVDEGAFLHSIAEKYKLSAREIEVFVLLAQGRNGPSIQKRLVIAGGTVKTHTNRIYSKLGICSRQELIDLIDEERRNLLP